MSKPKNEVYVLRSQVHFGSLKTSVPKGTKVEVDRTRNIVKFDGVERDNINEVDLMIKAGCIVPCGSECEVAQESRTEHSKMDVRKSDLDSMSKEIDISDTKKDVRDKKRKTAGAEKKMQVIKENEREENERGISVVRNNASTGMKADTEREILEVVNGDDFETVARIPEAKESKKASFGLSATDDAKDVAAAINGQEGTVVKKIGKSDSTKSIVSGKKLSAKRAGSGSEEKAKAMAEERKAASAARRAKAKK